MIIRNDNVLFGNVELRMLQKIFAYRLGKIGEHVTRGPKCAGGFGKADCFDHISYELRDIKEENPGYEELAAWHQRSGLPLKRFFNTSGLLYKSMGLKDKLPGMSEEEMLQLLATDGMLVKRPLLVGGDFVLVGFKEAQWAERLGKL